MPRPTHWGRSPRTSGKEVRREPTDGASNEKDQAFWRQISPLASQVSLQGQHDIHFDNPEGVAKEIITVLNTLE
jgi:hypothetical protein